MNHLHHYFFITYISICSVISANILGIPNRKMVRTAIDPSKHLVMSSQNEREDNMERGFAITDYQVCGLSITIH